MNHTERLIQAIGDRPLPPVEQWHPDYCGELDLLIKADGRWIYQGSELQRERLKQLFSRVIKKEQQRYFLVTPVEKLGIQVEWQPFAIIDFEWQSRDGEVCLQFLDNCGNHIVLNDASQLEFSEFQQQSLPCIRVRRNLFAGFSRACYYRLIDIARVKRVADQDQLWLTSAGIDFCLGRFRDTE